MRFFKIYFIIFFIASCATSNRKEPVSFIGNELSYFSFKDLSGDYFIKRETIKSSKQLMVRQSLFPLGKENAPLEKTVTVSNLGSISTKKGRSVAVRPVASQHSIWFEQKEFFSQLKLNVEKKGLDIYLKSPEEKWQGNHFLKLPKGSRFCWFSQIPECLKVILNLDKKSQRALTFYIVWDSYPYYGEQYQNLSGRVVSSATVAYDSEVEGSLRYSVMVEGQVIFYHFSPKLEFEKMFWVAQGIVMLREQR